MGSWFPLPPSSVVQALDRLPVHFLCTHPYSRQGFRSHRHSHFLLSILLLLAGDINLNPGPPYTSSSLNFAHLNIHSASSITDTINKPALLQEFISDYKLDILALTETWLPPDTLPATINSLTPPNYTFFHSPRPQGRGGSIALLCRSFLKITKLTLPSFSSFEALCVQLTCSTSSFIILTVYHPPSPNLDNVFLTEFSSLLQDLVTSPSELIITGDFNFHVNNSNCPSAISFLSLLDTFDLTQLVSFPTHTAGNTLDLLITRSSSNLFSDIRPIDPILSDHYAILSTFNTPSSARPPRITKQVRNIKGIDPLLFSEDIFNSCLYSAPASTLPAFSQQLSSTLSSLLDKHAPLKTVSCSSRKHKPFITNEILTEKSKRSKLETLYRKNKNTPNCESFKSKFKEQAKKVAKLISLERRSYFRNLISSYSMQPKKLWSALDSLLCRKSATCLPACDSPSLLASSFLNYFGDKIAKLSSTLTSSASSSSPHVPPETSPPSLSSFSPASFDEVRNAILSASNATCSLDSIPTCLLKSCLNALLQPISTLINLSLSEGLFPDDFKHAIVTPLHKKHSLPQDELSSYRPISINFISKILERIIHSRLKTHLNTFPSLSRFQSAYRKFHSTETALLRIHNDLLQSINTQKVSALILLDLSAAFDTIDHNILLTRLESNFGISGTALSLLSSYLTNRSQSVLIGNHSSSLFLTGVPQGSVLGPLVFCLYTSPLSYIFSSNLPCLLSSLCPNDDTQLYISFSSSDSAYNLTVLSSTIDSVYTWFTINRLSVNQSKTEFLLVGTPKQRSKLTATSVSFCLVMFSLLLTLAGILVLSVNTFDSDLSFKKNSLNT